MVPVTHTKHCFDREQDSRFILQSGVPYSEDVGMLPLPL